MRDTFASAFREASPRDVIMHKHSPVMPGCLPSLMICSVAALTLHMKVEESRVFDLQADVTPWFQGSLSEGMSTTVEAIQVCYSRCDYTYSW